MNLENVSPYQGQDVAHVVEQEQVELQVVEQQKDRLQEAELETYQEEQKVEKAQSGQAQEVFPIQTHFALDFGLAYLSAYPSSTRIGRSGNCLVHRFSDLGPKNGLLVCSLHTVVY